MSTNTIIILVAFVVYMGMMILIGALNSKQSNNEDYFLGGRGLGSWTAALSAQASDMSGWLLMGLPGAIYVAGTGEVWIAIGLLIGTILNWFLVARPEINIYGAPVGTLMSYFYMAALNYFFMCRTLDRRPRLLRIFSGSVAASLLMGLSAWAVYGLASRFVGLDSWFKIALCMCMGVGLAVIVYLVSAICLKAITKADMKLIPGGEKVAKLLHIH